MANIRASLFSEIGKKTTSAISNFFSKAKTVTKRKLAENIKKHKDTFKPDELAGQIASGFKEGSLFKFSKGVAWSGRGLGNLYKRFDQRGFNTAQRVMQGKLRPASFSGAVKSALVMPIHVSKRMVVGLASVPANIGGFLLRHPKTTMTLAAGAGIVHGSIKASLNDLRTRSASKANTGRHQMSGNHLGADGLTLSLSRLRHR